MNILRLILEHLEELLPILIFIIVAISSVFTSMKKGRRDQEQESPDASDPPIAPPQPRERRAVERPENISDEMRRALEDIFEAKKPQPARPAGTPARAAAGQPAKAARSTPRAHEPDEWARSVAEREAKTAIKDAQKAAAKAARTQPVAEDIKPNSPNALTAQARTGIVWSEILQPPVSMR
jgi:hypothetical protein